LRALRCLEKWFVLADLCIVLTVGAACDDPGQVGRTLSRQIQDLRNRHTWAIDRRSLWLSATFARVIGYSAADGSGLYKVGAFGLQATNGRRCPDPLNVSNRMSGRTMFAGMGPFMVALIRPICGCGAAMPWCRKVTPRRLLRWCLALLWVALAWSLRQAYASHA